MPTYQYRCADCGDDLEAVQRFTDDALTECPTCGGSLRKRFSAVGIVFKGSGFYATDNRTKGARSASATKEAKGESKSEPSSTKSGSGSSSSSGSSQNSAGPGGAKKDASAA
jgi:putative FmdB family regulatory protein